MRRTANTSSDSAIGNPVRAVHVIHAYNAGVSGIHYVDFAGGINSNAGGIIELTRVGTTGAPIRGPIRAAHIVDADDAAIVRISDVDSAGRIERNAIGAVKLADVAALTAK